MKTLGLNAHLEGCWGKDRQRKTFLRFQCIKKIIPDAIEPKASVKKNVYTYLIKILGLRTATPLVTTTYIEFKYKARPYLHLCTCNPLTPRELI